MKFLIHGNTPNVRTGYGVQCRALASYLVDELGHEVAISSTFGNQYGISDWVTPAGNRVRMYPNGIFQNSPDTILANADHWFDGDRSSGWIITLLDVWCLLPRARDFRDYNVAAWCPVDHFPAPPEVTAFLSEAQATPLAMSRYGEAQLRHAGLDPLYLPLTVDTTVYKPTFEVEIAGQRVTGRELFGLGNENFVVGMVAMNKDPIDRKGFNEAFRAFGQFWKNHNEARLLVHTEKTGAAGGLNLPTLAAYCSVPEHSLIFTDQYAYRIGLSAEMMASFYTACDVYLAPSHGEGFGVPMIEAQACGVPVIATDATAQSELVGPGWKVHGQPWWDNAQTSSYVVPHIADIIDKLEEAHTTLEGDSTELAEKCIEHAARYDPQIVFPDLLEPWIESVTPKPPVKLEPMTGDDLDVVVPLRRIENLGRLEASFAETRPEGCRLVIVHDTDTQVPLSFATGEYTKFVSTGEPMTSYAEKVNRAVGSRAWMLIVGDDVEFTAGWFEHAVEATRHGHVIGTNDSEPGRTRNPDVAAGRHADHFFIRTEYVDKLGACLDGPGCVAPEDYVHWFVDREIIELAKARKAFVFAEESRIIHHHPGYDGDETAREADPTYMLAVDSSASDERLWQSRAPLIEQHRVLTLEELPS